MSQLSQPSVLPIDSVKSILEYCQMALLNNVDNLIDGNNNVDVEKLFSVCENFGHMVRVDVCQELLRRNYNEQNDETKEDIPPGRRFHVDEHGNIVYDFGFSGAPLLPYRNLGLSASEFTQRYINIPKEKRFSFFNNVLRDSEREKLVDVVNVLIDYEYMSPDIDHSDKLIQMLNKFIKTTLQLRDNHLQYKYLRKIANKIDFKMREE